MFLLLKGDDRDYSLQRITEHLNGLPLDKLYSVTVSESTRTNDQNRLIWAMYEQILRLGGEDMAGWSREDLHSFFLQNHFGSEEINVFGKVSHVPLRRSSKLSKKDFSLYVDSVVRFMAEKGVSLQMPGDL